MTFYMQKTACFGLEIITSYVILTLDPTVCGVSGLREKSLDCNLIRP